MSNLGAVTRIQSALEAPICWFACRRHVLELVQGAAWKAIFTDKSKQPADALCEKLWAFANGPNYPKSLDATSCPFIFKERAKLFKTQRERLVDLASHLDSEKVGSTSLPRDDYKFLWMLVKVQT